MYIDIIRPLLGRPDKNGCYPINRNVLGQCTFDGDKELMFLFKNGARINKANKNNQTPLCLAIRSLGNCLNNKDMAEFLQLIDNLQ